MYDIYLHKNNLSDYVTSGRKELTRQLQVDNAGEGQYKQLNNFFISIKKYFYN